MKDLGKINPPMLRIGDEAEGQRIDNYLLRMLKGVPKSHIYRILRRGEVRVNSGRRAADYRLQAGDLVRMPPLRTPVPNAARKPLPLAGMREIGVLHEDDHLLILNKPAGMAVHGGSGIRAGVIEQLRAQRPSARFLELVHRLDRDTSGILLLAKKRRALTALHQQLREGRVRKHYLALVNGIWTESKKHVTLSLRKYLTSAGERRVIVDAAGQEAHTIISMERTWSEFSLLRAEIKTGRTHQIRVHLAHLGFPIAGDDKYGDFELNRQLIRRGLKRMFLHASAIRFAHPAEDRVMAINAPLPAALTGFLETL